MTVEEKVEYILDGWIDHLRKTDPDRLAAAEAKVNGKDR